MSIELIKETIRVNQLIGEDLTQSVVENDIIVPDVKPDVARILLLDGDIYSYSTEIFQDRVSVSGTIQYKILYISDDENRSVKSINTSTNFLCGLDIPNARSGMSCRVKCEIEHISYEILNGRKISVKAIIKAVGRLTEEIEQDIISGLGEIEDVQVLKNNVRINSSLGESSEEFTLREAMEVPAGKPTVREMLRNDIKIIGKDYKVTDDKVIVRGELSVSTLYIGDDETGSVQFMEHQLPFTQLVSLVGANDYSTCDVDFQINDSRFEPAEDSDGELRIVNGEVVLKVTASGYCKKNVELLEDAYSCQAKLGIDKELFRAEEILADNRGQIILKDTISMQEGSPEIAEVFNVLCKPSISEVRVFDDKVVVEGIVDNNILYLANSEEQPVVCNNQEVPYKHTIDIKGIKQGMACQPNVEIEHCDYSMVSGSEVEIRLVMSVAAKVISHNSIPLIVKVNETPIDEKVFEGQPSLTIYFTRSGDSLWNIAKKYYVTMDEIRSVNNISDRDALNPGQQLIIPRRIS